MKNTQALQTFCTGRLEEFDALWNEFKQAAAKDFGDFWTRQVAMGLPIEALKDWKRRRIAQECTGEDILPWGSEKESV